MITEQPLTVVSSGPEVSMHPALSTFQAATQPSILEPSLPHHFVPDSQSASSVQSTKLRPLPDGRLGADRRSLNGPIVGIGAAPEAIASQGVGARIGREDAIEVGAS